MNVSKGQSRPTLEDAFDALRRSEAQLRTFIDELPALAWCLLPDGSIVFFNQQWHTHTAEISSWPSPPVTPRRTRARS